MTGQQPQTAGPTMSRRRLLTAGAAGAAMALGGSALSSLADAEIGRAHV